jgi:hypothetical protein
MYSLQKPTCLQHMILHLYEKIGVSVITTLAWNLKRSDMVTVTKLEEP